MAMDHDIAAMYGTPSASTEDQEKVAEAQLFSKLAAENDINLAELTDEQVTALYNHTFDKEAGAAPEAAPEGDLEPAVDDETAKVAAAAEQEFVAKQEWQEKVAEADKLGRIMAHSYVQEMNEIAAAQGGHAKVAGEMPAAFAANAEKKKEEGGEGKKCEKCGKSDCDCPAAKDGDKEASAIDQLAGRHAVELAKTAGFDEEEAIQRISSVMTLGLCAQSEKTASATSLEDTIHIRGLEHLEAAGYQVTWEEAK